MSWVAIKYWVTYPLEKLGSWTEDPGIILSSSCILESWCRRGGKEEQEEGRLNLQHLLLALAWALQIKLSCFFLGAHEYLFVLVAAHASSAPKRGRAATVSREGGTGTQRNPPSIEVCRGQSEEV